MVSLDIFPLEEFYSHDIYHTGAVNDHLSMVKDGGIAIPVHETNTMSIGEGGVMADKGKEQIPLGQRICDSPFLLLIAGTVVMFVTYTAWGLIEMFTLPPAGLP